MAKFLKSQDWIDKVYYPGLNNHPDNEIAKIQMKGFGGMLTFDLNKNVKVKKFLQSLKIIKPSMSLAGVESTMLVPAETSHHLLKEEDRVEQGITNNLIRFSVGIEDTEDLIEDIEQALKVSKK